MAYLITVGILAYIGFLEWMDRRNYGPAHQF